MTCFVSLATRIPSSEKVYLSNPIPRAPRPRDS
jgi:hypothetical protein